MKKIIAKVLAVAVVVSAIAACPVMAGDVSTQTVTHPCLHENMHYTVKSESSAWTSDGANGHGHEAILEGYCVECDYVEEKEDIIDVEPHDLIIYWREYFRDSNGEIVGVWNHMECTVCGARF